MGAFLAPGNNCQEMDCGPGVVSKVFFNRKERKALLRYRFGG